MKPVVLLSCFTMAAAATSLYSADFWEKKPFEEWTDKEVSRVLTNSPWAKDVAVNMPAGTGGGRRGGRGSRGNAGVNVGSGTVGFGGGVGSGGAVMSGGAIPRDGGTGDGGGMDGGGSPPSIAARVRWQSALPVKQALMKVKFGKDAGNSADAKATLARPEEFYVIAIENLPPVMGNTGTEQLFARIKESTVLTVKGRAPLHPQDVKTGQTENGLVVYFFFSKAMPFTRVDKEIEFATRFGPVELRRKFKLQEMVYAGKLEL